MINNEQYLIQKYAEARENMNQPGSATEYWKGSMDTYHSLLILGFNDWALPGSVGYYVFYEGMNYDSALGKVERERETTNDQSEDMEQFNTKEEIVDLLVKRCGMKRSTFYNTDTNKQREKHWTFNRTLNFYMGLKNQNC